jgi:hypothetical protein
MSALAGELIATVRSAGGSFQIVDGRVGVEAPAPLPCELMERLRALKGEVRLLASEEPGQSVLSDGVTAENIEERAALAADSVPAVYLDAWARLNQKPKGVSEAEWRRALDDGGLFLDGWGADAATMLWTASELFDVPHDGRPGGLVWQLKGERIGALGEERARLRGGRTIGRRARE